MARQDPLAACQGAVRQEVVHRASGPLAVAFQVVRPSLATVRQGPSAGPAAAPVVGLVAFLSWGLVLTTGLAVAILYSILVRAGLSFG